MADMQIKIVDENILFTSIQIKDEDFSGELVFVYGEFPHESRKLLYVVW